MLNKSGRLTVEHLTVNNAHTQQDWRYGYMQFDISDLISSLFSIKKFDATIFCRLMAA